MEAAGSSVSFAILSVIMTWLPTVAGSPLWPSATQVPLHTQSLHPVSSGGSVGFSLDHSSAFACRIGEAANPGPDSFQLQVGTTNPSGLRGKEAHLVECGTGIFFVVAETQLSKATQPAVRGVMSQLGRQQNRHIRSLFGAPAALRAGSTWAGSWTGVAQFTDYPVRDLCLSWPAGIWQSGRVMAAQHIVGQTPVTVAAVYGFAPGNTHVDALSRTDSMLEVFTKEIILGRKGIRVVAGDYNHPESSLQQLAVWRQQGWVEAQTLASRLGSNLSK